MIWMQKCLFHKNILIEFERRMAMLLVFVCGFILGTIGGIVIISLCQAASRSERDINHGDSDFRN